MLNEKIEKALNSQVNAEIYSAYLYLSMEAYFESVNLAGCGNWMRVQAQEELSHAAKIYDYIIERGGRVYLDTIEKPPAEWDSPLGAFQAAYKHEQKVTSLINGLVDLSNQEKDHATSSFLKWFVDEQVEEEASADEIVQKLKMVEKTPGMHFMIDRELAQRIFKPPTKDSEGD